MKQRTNRYRGFFTLSALILTGILISTSISSAYSLLKIQKHYKNRMWFYKLYFLSYSGIYYASQHINDIPVFTETPEKSTLYSLSENGFQLNNLDFPVYIYKTQDKIFSIVKGSHQTKMIFCATFTIDNDQVTLGKIEKF